MIRLLCTLCLAVILPISAQASSTASIINTNCSGSLTSSLIDGASFVCAGNLTLDGGFITSDSLISISVDGDLFVNNIVFTSPNITFEALSGTIDIGGGLVANANSLILTASIINIAKDAKLNIPQIDPIPEPTTYAMLLFGLGLITYRRQFKN
jgi:hypothetical protein